MSIKLGIQGASGRMGQQILSELCAQPGFVVADLLVSDNSRLLGQSFNGVAYRTLAMLATAMSTKTMPAKISCDVWLDFSNAAASLALARECAQNKTPILVGTTGHSQSEMIELRALAQTTALLYAPNTSVGVSVLLQVLKLVEQLLSASEQDYDVEISEVHHRNKKDAPSGTAMLLAAQLKQAQLKRGQLKRGDIHISSLRGGDVAGEHTVHFLGLGERLEFSHRVGNRSVFARGALRLAKILVLKAPGFYEVSEMG